MNQIGYELTQTVAPTGEIVTLQEAKRYLALDGDDDDTLLTGVLIPSAVDSVQTSLNRQLLTATWQLKLGSFPRHGEYQRLPLGQLQTVDKIDYLDTEGVSTEWDAAEYSYQAGDNGMIWPAANVQWPTTNCDPSSVVIDFTCGYGDARDKIPAALRNAVLLQVAHNYERRDPVEAGTYNEVPRTIKHLCQQFALQDIFEVYANA